MRWIAAALLTLTPALGLAGQTFLQKPITVAVIDSGFGYKGLGHNAKLCKYGHKDFSIAQVYDSRFNTSDPIPLDVSGHGTNVAGLIEDYAKDANFCLVIIKYVNHYKKDDTNTALMKALKYADEIKVDIINYSGASIGYIPEEVTLIKKFIDSGGIFITSAGNDKSELNGKTKYKIYPAMDDDRIIVVGSKNPFPVKNLFASGGELEEHGWKVENRMPDIQEKLDKNGFCVLEIEEEAKDVIQVDDMNIPVPYKYTYYRVLIKHDDKVFLKSDFSNWGQRVNRWEIGDMQTSYGITFSGTSQATAIATGKLVGQLYEKLNKLSER